VICAIVDKVQQLTVSSAGSERLNEARDPAEFIIRKDVSDLSDKVIALPIPQVPIPSPCHLAALLPLES
jgi:hypothetical protein